MSIQKKSLHTDIFDTLRDRIVYLEYPPGMPLIEKDLCDEFKVSRTPLREAIRKRIVESRGELKGGPGEPAVVSAIDLDDGKIARRSWSVAAIMARVPSKEASISPRWLPKSATRGADSQAKSMGLSYDSRELATTHRGL